MNKLGVALVIMFLSFNINAQNTKVEQFANQKGTLIKKEVISSGLVSSKKDILEYVDINVVHFENVVNKSAQIGLKFEYIKDKKKAISYLDEDEIADFIQSIKLAQEKISAIHLDSVNHNIEFTYTSKSGLQFGYLSIRKEWVPYLLINDNALIIEQKAVEDLLFSLETYAKIHINKLKSGTK